MKKTISLLAALALGLAGFGASAVPASAGTNIGRVRNYSGEPVGIHCDYQDSDENGEPTYYLIEKYGTNPKANSTYFCGGPNGDTDQFQAPHDVRCLHYVGPGYTDGWYILRPSKFQKVSGLALASVYAYSSSRCGGKPTFSYQPESP